MMKLSMRRALLATIPAIAMASPAFAQMPTPTPTQFIAKAGASDMYEEKSSKLVLASTKNADVKSFADMMVTDHMKTTAAVKSAASQAGMHPKPPKLDPIQKTMIAKLTAAKGNKRDKIYVDQQKKAHQTALDLMQTYSGSGTEPHLKQAATSAVPIVQHHIEMLNGMTAM
jgi:putative membrane protein